MLESKNKNKDSIKLIFIVFRLFICDFNQEASVKPKLSFISPFGGGIKLSLVEVKGEDNLKLNRSNN
jgi:hypothetical protein